MFQFQRCDTGRLPESSRGFVEEPKVKAMQNPSKADCIVVLSAASRLADQATLDLDADHLGLSRNALKTTAAFLIERDCFKRHSDLDGHLSVGALSLQGRLRLEQLAAG